MDNNNTIEGQNAALAGAAETVISASAAMAKAADPVTDAPKLDLPKAATLDVASSSTAPKVEQLKVEPLPLDAVTPPSAGDTNRASSKAAAAAPARAWFNPIAAAVALAAAFGVLAGALGASALVWPESEALSTSTAAAPQDIRAVHTAIEQIRTELAALRTGVEAGTRSASAQFGKITERFDRVERAQTERSAKLAKAVDAVERLERRVDLAPAKETTGSVTPPPAAAAPAAAAPAHPPQPTIVPGWTVRDVYRGVALIQGARMGTIEVEAGDTVPFLGRIESIRRQDGHWVVVTSKGVIASAR